MKDMRPFVVQLQDVGLDAIASVGGKNASLGEMMRALVPHGVRVPRGFALTAAAFRAHLAGAELDRWIYASLERVDVHDVAQVAHVAHAIRRAILAAPLPLAIVEQVRAAYRELSRAYDVDEADVAVRSSATAEDLPSASFAGQQESFLNVQGMDGLDTAIRACMASLFTDRAIAYRAERGFDHRGVALSVGVQKMVRSDLGAAGVLFTLDTESGFRDTILINSAYGLGELVVQGRVKPDELWIFKPTLTAGFRAVIRRERGDKATKLVYGAGGTHRTEEVRVPLSERLRFSISDDDALTLARWSQLIEAHYSASSGHPTPMDIEWARDGRDGRLYILQARPETVHGQAAQPHIDLYRRLGSAPVLAHGKSVGRKVGAGVARLIHSPAELGAFQDGEVLVARMTDPDWEPVLSRAAAVVTEEGGRTCHAAIVARELGLPCVVGTGDATRTVPTGREVTVSCAEGDEGRVYDGRVEFAHEVIDPATLPAPRVPLMLTLANPERAFHLARLPSAGVGLVRLEFVISSWIGVHPLALVHPERVTSAEARRMIGERTQGYAQPTEFFVDRLASGVAQIAAAFFPRPVLVRFSDFKTNEYANLLGGTDFEPTEANPMIGFRGASRYYDPRYREGFALECAAIRRVREDLGLTNVKVMVPFCRTLTEADRVLAELATHGLSRRPAGAAQSASDLEVWVMCEIPNNVVLASEFADRFDGFSIGSNDLTQLTLGVDRDSGLLAHIFDERDPGVKTLIATVVKAAHAKGRAVGICGQAPSDYPELAEWLADIGIDSISLNPDSLATVAQRLARPARR